MLPSVRTPRTRGVHVMKHKLALGGALTLAVTVGVVAGASAGNDVRRRDAAALTVPAAASVAAESVNTAGHARLRAILRRLTTVDGGPGALVAVRSRHGSSVLTSGVADVDSRAPVDRDSR